LFVLFVFVSVSAAEAVEMDPDLSAYLSFDAIDNGVVADMTANGNDGLLTVDADLEDGKFGSAIVFGSGLRVDFDGANFVGPPEDAVTMAMWINVEAVTAEMELFDCIGTGHGDGQYHFELRSGGPVRWFHRDETSTQVFNIQTGNVPTGEWAHIAGTYDSDSGEAALYINGKEVTKVPGSGAALSIDWAVTAGIGQHKGGRQFLGLMDEFYMFKRALSAEEITALMDGLFGPNLAVEPGGKLATTWAEVKR
jgi:hypothetical protein